MVVARFLLIISISCFSLRVSANEELSALVTDMKEGINWAHLGASVSNVGNIPSSDRSIYDPLLLDVELEKLSSFELRALDIPVQFDADRDPLLGTIDYLRRLIQLYKAHMASEPAFMGKVYDEPGRAVGDLVLERKLKVRELMIDLTLDHITLNEASFVVMHGLSHIWNSFFSFNTFNENRAKVIQDRLGPSFSIFIEEILEHINLRMPEASGFRGYYQRQVTRSLLDWLNGESRSSFVGESVSRLLRDSPEYFSSDLRGELLMAVESQKGFEGFLDVYWPRELVSPEHELRLPSLEGFKIIDPVFLSRGNLSEIDQRVIVDSYRVGVEDTLPRQGSSRPPGYPFRCEKFL